MLTSTGSTSPTAIRCCGAPSFGVDEGEIVCVLARTARKSTLMKHDLGAGDPRAGRHHVPRSASMDSRASAAALPRHVLERRRLFRSHRARQRAARRPQPRARPKRAETWHGWRPVPASAARSAQLAHTLSGGEQQMVAIARASWRARAC